MRLGTFHCISKHLLDAEVDISRDFADAVEFSIRGYIWQEKLNHTEIEYPADWWQAFKKRWFPKWLLNRYPVKNILHVIDIAAMYPNYKPVTEPHLMALRHAIYNYDGRLVSIKE